MMVAPEGFALSFQDVHIHSENLAVFVAADDDATKSDLPVSWILRWRGEWSSQPIKTVASSVTQANLPRPTVLVMGIDGTIIRWSEGPLVEETIDASEAGPQTLGDLREIRTIGERAHVVGMNRAAYRCDGVGMWTRIDQGLRVESDDSEAGLNSVDGFDEREVYAVGWDGEIWMSDGNRWLQAHSPTNLALNKVLCAADGKVYACGQAGVLLCGRNDEWIVIEQDVTDETFWGAAWFDNHMYFSTANGVFCLDGKRLFQVPIKDEDGADLVTRMGDCFFRLEANGGVMWSIGEKMAIYTYDGVVWAETPYE